ncbi:hypothetical protein [Streptomyces griseoluteus]|uniref:hypothetical protein n=1 Tax=Streptomyces griseoluteus TaxID=29306 RepID=UPI003700765A
MKNQPGGGPGVVGVAGGSDLGDAALQRDVGVVGFSAVKETGRGGIFMTIGTPQLRLRPVPVSTTDMPPIPGEPGDFLVTVFGEGGRQIFNLWFCAFKNFWTKIV